MVGDRSGTRSTRSAARQLETSNEIHRQDSPEVQERRREFREELARIDPRRLVFVDECGANTAMTRTYGRAPAGQRVYSDAPGRWDSITLTCGMRLDGPMAAEVFPGDTNTVMFEDYVEEVLVPD